MEEWIKPVMRTIRHIKRAFLKQKLPATYQLKKQKANTAMEYLLEQTDNHQSIRGPKRKMTAEEIKKKRQAYQKKQRVQVVKFFMPAILFAIFVFFFVLKTSSYPIAGQSMKPTLNAGERVLVQRTKQVARYDVIAFKAPLASKGTYVKRIIGVPGDRIWVNEGKLYISEEPIASDNEALPENASRFDLSEEAAAQLRLFQKIPAGHYFVLGDNRTHSSDSRTFGFVEIQAIEGIVVFKMAPFKEIGKVK